MSIVVLLAIASFSIFHLFPWTHAQNSVQVSDIPREANQKFADDCRYQGDGIPYRDLGSDTEKPEATPELVGEFNASPQDVDEPEESSDLTVDESEKGAPDGIDAELRQ